MLVKKNNTLSESIKNVRTPWGVSDYADIVAPGIVFYSTPSHGGYKVDKTLLATIPKKYVNASGWYEEDCEALKVVLAFPQYFTADKVELARELYGRMFDDNGRYISD